MGLLFSQEWGEVVPEVAAEAGLGVVGGVAVVLLASPTGRKWLRTGAAGAAKGATVVGTAIATLFADLRVGWTDLFQELKPIKSVRAKQNPV